LFNIKDAPADILNILADIFNIVTNASRTHAALQGSCDTTQAVPPDFFFVTHPIVAVLFWNHSNLNFLKKTLMPARYVRFGCPRSSVVRYTTSLLDMYYNTSQNFASQIQL